MINGDLSEAKQGFALLEDVDEATFVRFIRWTYSKDYPAAEHAIVEDEEHLNPTTEDSLAGGANASTSSETKPEPDPADDDWGVWGSVRKKDKKKKKENTAPPPGTLKESFITKSDGVWVFDDTLVASGRSNKSPKEDYTDVFLGHARLYVFAEKYDIQPLKELALHRLQHTLAIYTLYPERVSDVIALLKYVYANTAEAAEGVEDIRTMLAHYVGTEMGVLVRDGEIRDLMLDDPEMLNDFLKMFALRVS